MFRRPPRQAGPEPVTTESPAEHLRQLSRHRTALLWRHPEPAGLRALVGSTRMWERRPTDDDFAEVRIAVDDRTPTVDIAALEPAAIEDLETSTAIAVPHLPLAVRLRAFSRVTLRGEREPVAGLARAMIGQLAVLHSPDELRIAVVAAPARLAAWDWARQLPHARIAAGTLVFETLQDLERTLGADLSDRPRYDPAAKAPASSAHLVVVLDGGEVAPSCRLVGVGPAATTVVDLSGQAPGGAGRWLLRLNVTAAAIAVDTPRQTTALGTPDSLTAALAEELARRLSTRQPAGAADTTDTTDAAGPITEGTREPAAAKPRSRSRRARPDGLPELLGLDGAEAIDPASTWRTGPDRDRLRVPIGTTPDGEPVELDLTEGPHGLIIGATGSGKSELLRTVIAGLAVTHAPSDLNFFLIDFRGGETFAPAGALPNTGAVAGHLIADLPEIERVRAALAGELHRRRDPRGGPRPRLLVAVEDFTDLLETRPDLVDLFLEIARDGADLGVHLLLSGQRLDQGRLRGLDSHLSYRIGLRTFSAADSRAVLGVDDCFELPAEPGHGYLKANASTLRRFRAVYATPVLDTIADRLSGAARPAHRIMLPPLDVPPGVTDLIDAERPGRLAVPVGITDRPFEQRREPYVLELGGTAGNVAVVGAPQTGKSTLLRTLISGLALTHSPREVQFFGIDLGGGGLHSLDGLPHVSGMAGRPDGDTIRRTVAEISALIDAREIRFSGQTGGVPDDPFGDVFLVVDGWAALRHEHREQASAVVDLATRGLGFGVHVVLTANRWAEIHGPVRDLFGTRVELRLGDPAESEIDRRAAQRVPESPGRGLTRDGQHFLTAVPWIDESQGVGALVGLVQATWPGERAPRLRLLPHLLPAAELAGPGIPIGIDEANLAPVRFDDAESSAHLVIFGDQGCGKTNLLRLIARSVADRFALDEARLVLVDYRRSLTGAVEGDHLLTHATSAHVLTDAMGSIHAAMSRRLPGPDLTREQLRDRSWWRGPDLFILVDDYDLVVTAGENPLSGLVELLPYARDIGLHLIIARRAGGAARASYEPLLRRLEQLDSPVLVMSGGPEEGKLFGKVRPRPQPPGRGVLARHSDGTTVLQTAWSDPDMPSLAR